MKKRKPDLKYRIRRLFVVLVCLAILASGGWYLWNNYSHKNAIASAPPVASQEPEETAPPEPEPVPESSSEPAEAPVSSTASAEDEWQLLLVNSTNPLPEGYEDTLELESVDGIFKMDTRAVESIRRMFAKAKEDGVNLMICSAYRSVEHQDSLFSKKVEQYITEGKAPEEAELSTASMIARPGTSEHHTGLAADIVTPEYQVLDDGFANTIAFGWLNQNAHLYGFILRYPQNKQEITQVIYEPWHYRYVGVEHATAIKEQGLTLEEYTELRAAPVLQPDESISAPEESATAPVQ